MVKKLFKHEINSYLRFMLPLYIALLGVAALARVVQFFETQSIVYYLVLIPMIVIFCIAIFTGFILTTWSIILRFYRHLFSGEGYLTLTLPVTPTQHIGVKLVTGVIFEALTLLVSLLSVVILLSGDVLVEVGKVIAYLLPYATEELGVNVALYAVEVIVLMVFGMFSSVLLYYACIAIGQTFSKNRALAALCIYFGYSFAMGIVSTVVQAVAAPFLNTILEAVVNNPTVVVHVSLLGALTLSVVQGIVCFFIVRYVMKKKLNLE